MSSICGITEINVVNIFIKVLLLLNNTFFSVVLFMMPKGKNMLKWFSSEDGDPGSGVS